MRLDVGVPTYKRKEKLHECVRSIAEARLNCSPVNVRLHIYFSITKELEDFKQSDTMKSWITLHMLTREFRAAEFWNAHLEGMDANALCYLTDDVVLDPMCLAKAWQALESLKFDGVVGLGIANATDGHPVKAAFGVVGEKFADRFPARHIFCPEYSCFYLDEELEKYAKSIKRFIFRPDASLVHYHPSFTGGTPDHTHTHHRRHKFMDVLIHSVRIKKGLVWGDSFEVIDKEGLN